MTSSNKCTSHTLSKLLRHTAVDEGLTFVLKYA